MELKSILLTIHILGVAFGAGGAMMLDFYLLRLVRGGTIDAADVKFVEYISRFVRIGLCLLWFSGPGLLYLAPDGLWSALANPRVQAKLFIVVGLTLNSWIIETLALQRVSQNRGHRLFDGVSQTTRSVLLGSAAFSAISWLWPLFLGVARHLNQHVPATDILAVYGMVLLMGFVAVQAGGRVLYSHASRREPVSTFGGA
jgi:hypothetical protein